MSFPISSPHLARVFFTRAIDSQHEWKTLALCGANLPQKEKIVESIQLLGYNFEISGDFENICDVDSLSCKINGKETFFEIYFSEPKEIVEQADWIKQDLVDQDAAISFVWGADFAAGACIGLISIALIDNSDSLIYYLDDEMKYSREMLMADIPLFLAELEK